MFEMISYRTMHAVTLYALPYCLEVIPCALSIILFFFIYQICLENEQVRAESKF